jgi:hypothetical protein
MAMVITAETNRGGFRVGGKRVGRALRGFWADGFAGVEVAEKPPLTT